MSLKPPSRSASNAKDQDKSSPVRAGKLATRYAPQTFLTKLAKLSNTGWTTHPRLLRLSDTEVSYYRKAKKEFREGDRKYL